MDVQRAAVECLESRRLLADISNYTGYTQEPLLRLPEGVLPSYNGPMEHADAKLFFSVGVRDLWAADLVTRTAVSLGVQIANVGNQISPLKGAGDKLFFAGNSAAHGNELWLSDGTPAGTRIVADLQPGPDSSGAKPLFPTGGVVYFTASFHSSNFDRLYVTDGTETGTRLVATFAGQTVGEMFSLGGELFVLVGDADSTTLYRTDGTEAGTIALTDVPGLPFATRSGPMPVSLGDSVVFQTHGYASKFYWVTDGTAAGTQQLLVRSTSPSIRKPSEPTVFDENVYLHHISPEQRDELWSTDGTAAGTTMVADFAPPQGGNADSFLLPGGKVNSDRLTFIRNSRSWSTDGTREGTQPLTRANAHIHRGLAALDNGTAITSFDGGTATTDGTDAGSTLAFVISNGDTAAFQQNLKIETDNQLYFFGGRTLWRLEDIDTRPPQLSAVFGTPTHVGAAFTEDVSGSVTADAFRVENVTTGQVLGSTNLGLPGSSTGSGWTASFVGFPFNRLPDGNYRVTLRPQKITDHAGLALQPSTAFGEFFQLLGDFNRTRSVDATDFATFANYFGRTTHTPTDLNLSGRTDLDDFTMFAIQFGKTLPPPAGRLTTTGVSDYANESFERQRIEPAPSVDARSLWSDLFVDPASASTDWL